jgi:hypothetical protein
VDYCVRGILRAALRLRCCCVQGVDTALLPTPRMLERRLRSGLTRFNANASSGLQFLIRSGVVTGDPAAVARFLHTHSASKALHKTRVGDVLGQLGGDEQSRHFHAVCGRALTLGLGLWAGWLAPAADVGCATMTFARGCLSGAARAVSPSL